uniref:Coiled-coil domain containing 157 n=1 Tax=Neogobius melanostomus TaxID=47308 RepID=A0A8C6UZD4_9GOBI
MSELLGRQDCIESLRKDLVDLQGAILDFPDKLSCNLDMVALLDRYDFIDGEDTFNQHSHIVLLELVIDRLLLLLQSFNVFVEQLENAFKKTLTQESGFVSLGLVVRNYWNNLITICDETLTLSSVPPSLNSSNGSNCSSAKSSTSSLSSWPQHHVVQSPTQINISIPKVDIQNVGSQTFESCLIPCDACYQTQSVLGKTGGALIELFQSEGLPSSLQPLSDAVLDTVELGQMTAADVIQWGAEEYKDMRRLGKHLQDVRGTVAPLKAKIEAVEKERDKFKSDMSKLQKELKEKVENYQATSVQLEFSLQKAQRSAKETEQRLQEEQQKTKKGADSCVKLEKDKETLKAKISNLTNAVTELKQHIKDCTERERLLVAFPDLNPPPLGNIYGIYRLMMLSSFKGTGNVILDMEKQVQANCIRIRVLEQENSTLRGSLEKLRERTQPRDTLHLNSSAAKTRSNSSTGAFSPGQSNK